MVLTMLFAIPPNLKTFSWIGIDPGTHHCGVSLYKVIDRNVGVIDSFTLHPGKHKHLAQIDPLIHGDRQMTLNILSQLLYIVIEETNPIGVVCEAPFWNSRFPGAYGPLVEVLTVLRNSLFRYNPHTPLITFSPGEVKETVKQAGTRGKDPMREAILRTPDILDRLTQPVEILDEHAIDATVVGYTWLKRQPFFEVFRELPKPARPEEFRSCWSSNSLYPGGWVHGL